MDHQTLILTVLNGGAAALGAYFLMQAYRSYQTHGSRHLEVVAIAVGVLTMGLLIEGFAVRFLGWSIPMAHVLEAVLGVVGFGLLAYSLHA